MIRLLLAVAAIAGLSRADYAFEFVCRDDTVAQVAPGDPAYFRFTIRNTGQSADVYAFDCRIRQNVPGWSIAYCILGRCVEPGTVMLDSLPAGATDTTPVIDVYTGTTAGEAVVEMHVRSQESPELADSITVHVLAGVGIEERGAATKRSPWPAPNPVRRGTTLWLGEPGRIRLWGTDGRLVAAGKSNTSGWSIPAGVRPGVYLIEIGSGRARVVVQ